MEEPQILIGLVGAVLVLIATAVARRARSTMSAADFEVIAGICHTVVLAVEQSCLGMPGPDKKRAAHDTLDEVFTHLGIRVPSALIDAFIEASILLLNRLKEEATR